MTREVLAADLAIAVALAALVLIVSPGVAVSAIIALIGLAACGLSLVWSAWRRRGSARSSRRGSPRSSRR